MKGKKSIRAGMPFLMITLLIVIGVLPFTREMPLDVDTAYSLNKLSQDTIRPEISSWGIEGRPSAGESFLAWANVTDYQSGVRNVSLILNSDNGTVRTVQNYPMFDNGTLYVRQIPGLPVNRTYLLRVLAFDLVNNSAISYSRTINRYPSPDPPIDPNITMPVVVTSSFVLFAIVLLLAYVYDRRQHSSQSIAPPREP